MFDVYHFIIVTSIHMFRVDHLATLRAKTGKEVMRMLIVETADPTKADILMFMILIPARGGRGFACT